MTSALALAAVVGYCGWNPTVTAGVQPSVTLDGNGTGLLSLPCLGVTGVSALSFTDNFGTTYTLDPVNDIQVSANGLVALKCPNSVNQYVFPEGFDNVQVTYAGGLSDPIDIANVTAALGSIDERIASMGLNQASIGTARLAYGAVFQSGDLLDIEKMVLDRYRLPKVSLRR